MTETTHLDNSTLVDLADALEETAETLSDNVVAATGMTSLGQRMLDFATRGTKRSASNLTSAPPSKRAHVPPQKPPRVRRAQPQPTAPAVEFPPAVESPSETPKTSPENVKLSWHQKTTAQEEADAKSDLQIRVKKRNGEWGTPTRFLRKNTVMLSVPNDLVEGENLK